MLCDSIISGTNIHDTYNKLYRFVFEYGEDIITERGACKSVLNVVSEVKYPNIWGKHDYWYGEKLDDYVNQFFCNNVNGFIYTYGERIHDFNDKYNQFEYVETKLKEQLDSGVFTRRAVMSLWDVSKDMFIEDVPCLNHLQFQLFKNKLYVTVTYRSHDINAYYPNLCGINSLTKFLVKRLNDYSGKQIGIGNMRVYSNNLHLYKTEI